MLKVAGVTFDHTVNYGSSLQAYALQTAIEHVSVEGENCSYRLIPLQAMTDYPQQKERMIRRIILFALRKVYFSRFSVFEKKYMKYAECSELGSLHSLNQQADAFVCGSDVIWNPDQNHHLGTFFLDFADKYKFSYAASFGKANAENQINPQEREWLNALNGISCREQSSAETVRNVTGRNAEVVVDPVLLLKASDWNLFIPEERNKKKYIFSYTTHLFPLYEEYLQKLSKETGLPIKRAVFKPKNGLKQRILIPQTPLQWLQQLRNAEYVVTNSFHATAFSIIFHKKFFTVVSGEKDKGINVRMNDLLTTLNLQERIYSSVPERIDLTEPDYTPIDSKLDQMRTDSLGFLQRNLEAAYEEKKQREQKGSEK